MIAYRLLTYLRTVLDAWLKDKDDAGWKLGPNVKVPAVNLLLRRGNPGFNSNEAEATYTSRSESEWPPARTRYIQYNLDAANLTLTTESPTIETTLELEALGKGSPLQFEVAFAEETEIAGHPTVNLIMSVGQDSQGRTPQELDVFVTLRHIDPTGKEVFYTGGQPSLHAYFT